MKKWRIRNENQKFLLEELTLENNPPSREHFETKNNILTEDCANIIIIIIITIIIIIIIKSIRK